MRTHHRCALVAAVLTAVVPLVSSPAVAAQPDCGERDFCLFAGPRQTGPILFQQTVTVHEDYVELVNVEDVQPPIDPRSARLPGLPEGLACVAVLYTEPHYGGDTQEIPYGYPLDVEALSELTGEPVGTIDADCG